MSKEKQIEEMIDALKKCSCVYTDCEQECAQCSNEELYDDTLNHIARTLYESGYRKQEWISVEERLPTWKDGKVLVFTTYGFSVCERTVNGRWQGKHANWITHWMELPEPPKGE